MKGHTFDFCAFTHPHIFQLLFASVAGIMIYVIGDDIVGGPCAFFLVLSFRISSRKSSISSCIGSLMAMVGESF